MYITAIEPVPLKTYEHLKIEINSARERNVRITVHCDCINSTAQSQQPSLCIDFLINLSVGSSGARVIEMLNHVISTSDCMFLR